MKRAKRDEVAILSQAVDDTTKRLTDLVHGEGWTPEEVEGIAQNIADLCGMMMALQDKGARDREAARDALRAVRS